MPNIREIMSPATCTVRPQATLVEAARAMRDQDVGDVIVVSDNDAVTGILTDRDLVVRGIADGRDPSTTTVGEICSGDLVTVTPQDDVRTAIDRMSDHAVRRVPVVEGGKPVGIVSLGDLAIEHDPDSALADISAAPPNSND
jgi:CBS domain-containing protein